MLRILRARRDPRLSDILGLPPDKDNSCIASTTRRWNGETRCLNPLSKTQRDHANRQLRQATKHLRQGRPIDNDLLDGIASDLLCSIHWHQTQRCRFVKNWTDLLVLFRLNNPRYALKHPDPPPSTMPQAAPARDTASSEHEIARHQTALYHVLSSGLALQVPSAHTARVPGPVPPRVVQPDEPCGICLLPFSHPAGLGDNSLRVARSGLQSKMPGAPANYDYVNLVWCRQCGTSYHRLCMDEWLRTAALPVPGTYTAQHPTCPTCRKYWLY